MDGRVKRPPAGSQVGAVLEPPLQFLQEEQGRVRIDPGLGRDGLVHADPGRLCDGIRNTHPKRDTRTGLAQPCGAHHDGRAFRGQRLGHWPRKARPSWWAPHGWARPVLVSRFGCVLRIPSHKRLGSACTRPSCPRPGSIRTRPCSSSKRCRGNPAWLPILRGQAHRPAPTFINSVLTAKDATFTLPSWPTSGTAGAAITTWACTRGRGPSLKARNFLDPFRSLAVWIPKS